MGERIEVRDKPSYGFWVTLAGVALLGVAVGLVVGYEKSLWWLPPAVLVSLLLVRWGAPIALGERITLVIDQDGIEDPSRGLRLAWDDVAAARVDETFVKATRTASLVVSARDPEAIPIEASIEDATVPSSAIAAHIERWWGRPVPTRHLTIAAADSAAQPGAPMLDLDTGRAGHGTGEPPLVVHYDRWSRILWTLAVFAVTLMMLGGAVAFVLDGKLLAPILFVPVAAHFARWTFKFVKLAFRRDPIVIVDSDGVTDPRDPIGVRWEDVEEASYAKVRIGSDTCHVVYLRLADYESWAARWRASWRPGLNEKPMDHPIEIAFGLKMSVPAEEIVDRIEREWGRPLPLESTRGTAHPRVRAARLDYARAS